MKRILITLAALFAVLAAQAQEAEYGVVNISVCNMRATANFDAEMVSQALLGTPVHILQINQRLYLCHFWLLLNLHHTLGQETGLEPATHRITIC